MSNDGTESRAAAAAKGCLAIFVMVVVVALGIVACSAMVNGSKPTPRPAPTFTPDSVEQTSPPPARSNGGMDNAESEMAYLIALKDAPFGYGAHSNANKEDTGQEVCSRFDRGDSVNSVVAYAISAGYGPTAPAAYLVGVAIAAFCPDHMDAMEDGA